jgi:hypothetical protein
VSAAEEWEPASYDGAAYRPVPDDDEKPEKWHRDNAAVFYALEEWQRTWDTHAYEYELANGRPPSSMNREKNRAAFRRQLIAQYGRGEPDPAWFDRRIAHLEKRGLAPSREFGR